MRVDRQELREIAKLGAIFAGLGFGFGLLRGEPLLGILAGALLFLMMIVIGGLPMLFGRRRR